MAIEIYIGLKTNCMYLNLQTMNLRIFSGPITIPHGRCNLISFLCRPRRLRGSDYSPAVFSDRIKEDK
jgi:hypothetical protein